MGILVDTNTTVGKLIVGEGGTMTLVGTGGGAYNSSTATNNYGVQFNGAILTAGNGGTALDTIYITGIGGNGGGAGQNGAEMDGVVQVNLNGTNPANSLNFINCVGGPSAGGSTFGINFNSSFTLTSGTLYLLNITGGGSSTSSNNAGAQITGGLSLVAPTIIANDIIGGPGLTQIKAS